MASKDSEECEDFTIDAQCDVNTNVRSYTLSKLLNEKGEECRVKVSTVWWGRVYQGYTNGCDNQVRRCDTQIKRSIRLMGVVLYHIR